MYTIAMAYAGTGNNQAIRKLLHVAVSDYYILVDISLYTDRQSTHRIIRSY